MSDQIAEFVVAEPQSISPEAEQNAAVSRQLRSNQKVAIVHDWFPFFRGGERVVAELCRQFRVTDIFTLLNFLKRGEVEENFPNVSIHTSPVDRLPFIKKYYRSLSFLYPTLIEQFDVTQYDTVISSSAAFSRGIITRPDQPHLCYVHSPARYAWDEQFSYLNQARLGFGPKGILVRCFLHQLRTWDARTAHGPDLILANSTYVRARIRQIYGRTARVVFPPVSLDEVEYVPKKNSYYVAASHLVAYKRMDLVVQAFNRMPCRRLMVVGEGPQLQELRRIAGSNITFLGHLPRRQYLHTIACARAMVFAGCEDFGITLAEAQASGTPLIAFSRGGARDIVRPLGESGSPSGVLFDRQSAETITDAVKHFETNCDRIKPESCRNNTFRFSVDRFRREIEEAFNSAIALNKRRNAIHSTHEFRL